MIIISLSNSYNFPRWMHVVAGMVRPSVRARITVASSWAGGDGRRRLSTSGERDECDHYGLFAQRWPVDG